MSNFVLSMSDIDTLNKQIENLMDNKPLPETEIKALCEKAKEALTEESNV
jgi:serine/threonine-protein phosphatase 2A catalytic subunit